MTEFCLQYISAGVPKWSGLWRIKTFRINPLRYHSIATTCHDYSQQSWKDNEPFPQEEAAEWLQSGSGWRHPGAGCCFILLMALPPLYPARSRSLASTQEPCIALAPQNTQKIAPNKWLETSWHGPGATLSSPLHRWQASSHHKYSQQEPCSVLNPITISCKWQR